METNARRKKVVFIFQEWVGTEASGQEQNLRSPGL
jgi:hypothetical protein